MRHGNRRKGMKPFWRKGTRNVSNTRTPIVPDKMDFVFTQIINPGDYVTCQSDKRIIVIGWLRGRLITPKRGRNCSVASICQDG